MSKQKTHWCLTIPARALSGFTEAARSTFLDAVGNRDGIKIPYSDEIDFNFTIGYLEGSDDATKEPHYHCLMSNPSGKSSTKGRCLTTLNANGFACNVDIYIQELQTTLLAYKRYMFKAEPDNEKSLVDLVLEDTIRSLREGGLMITRDKFHAELLKLKGATWCTRNKAIIDTFSMNTLLFDNNRLIKKEVNVERIISRGKNLIACFHDTILKNIEAYGVETEHGLFDGLSNEYKAKAITLIALTPMLFSRSEDVDNIPGLYLWGQASSGKSFLFNSSKCYKPLATDATGVGRFKLDGVESGILMDDIQSFTIDADNNIATIRALCLGGATRIKVHSDTKLIHAFVVCTSNAKPDFLDSVYSKVEASAWKRRFVCLKMSKDNFVDFVASSGNEFDYSCMFEHIAHFYMGLYKDCIAVSSNFKIFEDYCNNCNRYIPETTKESIPEIKESCMSIDEVDDAILTETCIRVEKEEEERQRKKQEDKEQNVEMGEPSGEPSVKKQRIE